MVLHRADRSGRLSKGSLGATLAITSVALFMSSLDNLVVTTALPVIRRSLHSGITGLEWTVNAYTLTFATLLITGATLGDRFGRKKVFLLGLGLFILGSAAAGLSQSIDQLIASRAIQGLGGAVVTPLTLTILSETAPVERRGTILGIWGAIGGLAVALGPVVGGAVVDGLSWNWIFLLNVPIGLIALPLGIALLTESKGPATSIDLAGIGFISTALLGLVYGTILSASHSWGSPEVLESLAVGVVFLAIFIYWEFHASSPMLSPVLFSHKGFGAINIASLLFSFGMFGSIFLLAQMLQLVGHFTPLQAGVRTLPWTAMPMVVAPIAGKIADKRGAKGLLGAGLFFQAAALVWITLQMDTHLNYLRLVPAFVLAGIGMSLFFVPVAQAVLGLVPESDKGIASGANNAIRELGGVFGIAVLASIFASRGGYQSASSIVQGTKEAVLVGAWIVGLGALVTLFIPSRKRPATASYVPESSAFVAPDLL